MSRRLISSAIALVVALTACTAIDAESPATTAALESTAITDDPAATTTAPPASTTATRPPASTTATLPPASTTATLPSASTTRSTVADDATDTNPGEPSRALLYDNWVRTDTYADSLELDIHAPAEVGPWPVVVTIHGGGWFGGDRDSMGFLADGLASRKIVTFNATYNTIAQGGRFPGMVDDVACAVQHARNVASEFTTTPDLVTIVGHSAGAHLASLVAFASGEFGQSCPEGSAQSPDAFVGLAGPYNTDQLALILSPMFGGTIQDVPDRWALGNPLTWVSTSPDIPSLLLHGDADQIAPIAFSEELEVALIEAGREVTFSVLFDRGHAEANSPRIVGDRVAAFVSDLGSR